MYKNPAERKMYALRPKEHGAGWEVDIVCKVDSFTFQKYNEAMDFYDAHHDKYEPR